MAESRRQPGEGSPTFDRVAITAGPSGARTAEAFSRVQREIAQEMAAALGRAEAKLERALADLDALDAKGAPDGEWLAQREVAETALWEYLVHREALGARGQEQAIRARYPIPRTRR